MHVIATAGHVDHGKSTLVRALTGMEPDRWAEERRRGMTIDLGFAWTALPSGEVVAFVDVPGHEHFVPTMLAGVGPVPAVAMVVAADGGWMPQSVEHLAAIDALGVRHGLLVVTRTDLASPEAAAARAYAEIAATSLGDVEVVMVSGLTGVGLDDLRAALDRLVARLPAPELGAPVRLWIDRAFTIPGSGTVVTGTLGAGELRVGDELELAGTGRLVRIRELQTMGASVPSVAAVARVGVNLRGVERVEVRRGDALLTPGRFLVTDLVDVRLNGDSARAERAPRRGPDSARAERAPRHGPDTLAALPSTVMLHVGSAAVTARVRPLGTDVARLRLSRRLPLHVGDRALLRDPGRGHIAGGITVLDVAPPPLRRRGSAAARAATLATMDGGPDEHGELRRRGLARRGELERMGLTVSTAPVAGDWHADPELWDELRRRLAREVARYATEHPLEPAAPTEVLRQLLRLPDRVLVEALIAPPLRAHAGRVGVGEWPSSLPEIVTRAVDALRADLALAPFLAPEAARLAELGLGRRELAAAVRAGVLVRLTDTVVLLPGAIDDALRVLAELPQPFTLSDARRALGTTRRVAVPLLELLDRRGESRRLPDDRRVVGPEAYTPAESVQTVPVVTRGGLA